MNGDEGYSSHYLAYASSKKTKTNREKLTSMTQTIELLPPSFSAALRFLMKRAHVTIEELEERSYISSRTISRLRTEERSEYSIDQVVAICVALHLPPWLSRLMIQRAGLLLRHTVQHQAYQFILDCLFMNSVDEVQQFLVTNGCKPLRLHQSVNR